MSAAGPPIEQGGQPGRVLVSDLVAGITRMWSRVRESNSFNRGSCNRSRSHPRPRGAGASCVLLDGTDPVGFSFVVVVNGIHYIDPVVVASARKRQGSEVRSHDGVSRRWPTKAFPRSARPSPTAASPPSGCPQARVPPTRPMDLKSSSWSSSSAVKMSAPTDSVPLSGTRNPDSRAPAVSRTPDRLRCRQYGDRRCPCPERPTAAVAWHAPPHSAV